MGAAMALPDLDLFAQAAPLLQKKIPSSGEMIPLLALERRGATKKLKPTPRKCRCAKPSLNSKSWD